MDLDKVKSRARNNAYLLLRQRPRSESEIRRRLTLKGYAAPVIEPIVEELRRAGELDDARFARLWVDSRMRANPAGDIVLRHELKEKGVAEAIIEAALQEKAKNFDEHEVAFAMAKEQFARLKKIDASAPLGTGRRKAMKRVYDFLLRRGFKYDTIRRITEELAGKSTDED